MTRRLDAAAVILSTLAVAFTLAGVLAAACADPTTPAPEWSMWLVCTGCACGVLSTITLVSARTASNGDA